MITTLNVWKNTDKLCQKYCGYRALVATIGCMRTTLCMMCEICADVKKKSKNGAELKKKH